MEGKLLITGASGKLGREILNYLENLDNVLKPSSSELDISNEKSVESYFTRNKISSVIHCAAIASVSKCEQDLENAIKINALGTAFLVKEFNKYNKLGRFVYISTDYVYPCLDGNYKETDSLGPFTVYGWTKLSGEIAVNTLSNYCVIRTSFFNPEDIPFDTAFVDSFSSKMPIKELAKEVVKMLRDKFVGNVNIGHDRLSLFDLYKKYKSSIKPENMPLGGKRAKDSSMDISLWRSINKNGN